MIHAGKLLSRWQNTNLKMYNNIVGEDKAMKNPFRRKPFSIVVGICLVVVVFVVGYTTSQSQSKTNIVSSPTRPANCVPFPWVNENKAGETAIVNSSQLLETPGLIDAIPTVTQHKVKNTYDLRPDLAQSNKLMVFVFRCNGTEDLYLVDPQTYNSGNVIPLEAGDVISGVTSPSDMYYHGMPPTQPNLYETTATPSSQKAGTSTPVSKVTSQATKAPYPGPGTSTSQPKSVVSPYPAP
jgi:hypothetical protein